MQPNLERRRFLALCAQLPAFAALGAEAAPAAKTCSNPDDLSSTEQALRTSLEYTDRSPDSAKACGSCAFFKRDGEGPCGECHVLNGPVDANGHCSSFNPKK